jgi:hypothetical protein
VNVNSVSTQPDETVVYDGRTSDGSQLAEKRTEVAARWTRWIRLDSSPHSPCVAFKVLHKGDDRIGIHVLYLNFKEEIEMKDEYTGGPAFPAAHFDLADHEHGMSLRDYFAAKALPMAIKEMNDAESYNLNDAATMAYHYADAMLKARQA